MIRKHLLVLVFGLLSCAAFGQVIRGTITASGDNRPVSNVFISIDDGTLNLQSGQDGSFIIEGLAPGRYILRFQHIQYQPELREVLLVLAKESVIDISLKIRSVALPEITVPGTNFTQDNALYQITAEETQRYPGTFFDPARFAATFPGVQIVNDQANQLIINGMSPDLMQWHLEGLEIVNPNHLANAGTLSDRPTATGGGVNMLSNQVLSNSRLLSGASGGYGNATSGIMDMYFKDGNINQREHTIQVGLLGIEGSTEGPFKKGGRSSYVINGRYSTIGLLSELGVDFGDEKIRFADIAINTQFHLGDKGARLKVFGFFGSNSNDFEAKEMEEWEEDKDRYNIKYSSGTDVVGATYAQPLGARGYLSVKSVFSYTQHDRTQELNDITTYSEESGEMNKWSSEIKYNGALGDSRISGSLLFVRDYIGLQREGQDGFYYADGINTLFRPEVNINTSFSNSISMKLGVAFAHYRNSNTWNFEPNAELKLQIKENQNIVFRYRLSSQALNSLIFVDTTRATRNYSLKPIRSHNLQLIYQLALDEGIVEMSASYASIFDVPVDVGVANEPSDYSALNIQPYPNDKALKSSGKGKSFTLNLGYRKDFTHSYYVSGNASIIVGLYTDSEGIVRGTSFESGYAFYTSAGKEWLKEKDYGLRTWGLNGGMVFHGGLREGIIDPQASEIALRTEYAEFSMSLVKLNDYYRLDLRLYFRKDKAKHSSTISLDVQNLIGVENDSFSYYDLLFQEVRKGTQLGLIPILSWRLDF